LSDAGYGSWFLVRQQFQDCEDRPVVGRNGLIQNLDFDYFPPILGAIENKVNQSLLLLATHLDFRADERERLASTKVINDSG
jgi:hypothetical protein